MKVTHARYPVKKKAKTAAARETEEISRKDAEIRRVIEERRSTPKEEEKRLKEVSKCIRKMHQRQEKNEKADGHPKNSRRIHRCQRNIPGIKSAKKRVLITKMKNEKGENISSHEGIANVFGEFHKKIHNDNEQDEYEQEIRENGNESNTDVHINDTEEMTRIPEITTEELQQDAIKKLKKKVNHQTATGYELKTSRHATMRQERW